MERMVSETAEYVQRGYVLKKRKWSRMGCIRIQAVKMSSIQPV